MERNSTYGQDLLFPYHLPASSAGASLLEEVLPGSRKGAFSVPSMVSMVQAYVDLSHGSSASAEYRCFGLLVTYWYTGYFLTDG